MDQHLKIMDGLRHDILNRPRCDCALDETCPHRVVIALLAGTATKLQMEMAVRFIFMDGKPAPAAAKDPLTEVIERASDKLLERGAVPVGVVGLRPQGDDEDWGEGGGGGGTVH